MERLILLVTLIAVFLPNDGECFHEDVNQPIREMGVLRTTYSLCGSSNDELVLGYKLQGI